MVTNPNLYEINTRAWLRRFDTEDKKAILEDVPISYWEKLVEKGIDYVWLMGIWKTCISTVKKYCLKEGPVKESFGNALGDYQTFSQGPTRHKADYSFGAVESGAGQLSIAVIVVEIEICQRGSSAKGQMNLFYFHVPAFGCDSKPVQDG